VSIAELPLKSSESTKLRDSLPRYRIEISKQVQKKVLKLTHNQKVQIGTFLRNLEAGIKLLKSAVWRLKGTKCVSQVYYLRVDRDKQWIRLFFRFYHGSLVVLHVEKRASNKVSNATISIVNTEIQSYESAMADKQRNG